jgi:hypothetical protein
MGADIENHQCDICRSTNKVKIRILGKTSVCITGCEIFLRGGFVVLNEKGGVSTCGIDKLEIREVAKMRTNKAYLVE